MKVLLDTNIIIHREASRVINKDIGQLFRWLDRLKLTKCIHPLTLLELKKNLDGKTVKSMEIKLDSYYHLQTQAPLHPQIKLFTNTIDKNQNDINDSILLNEVINDRVDLFITEDKKIHTKAALLAIPEKVYKIESFLEKVISENPSLVDYKVLSVKKQFFGNIKLEDDFFDSFRVDYFNFDKWFNKKADEIAYTCYYRDILGAFLYLKVEDTDEVYSDIIPTFRPKKRLKIGTFKVVLNGFKIGERFIKIIFDNALHFQVDEIYVTIFDKSPEQQRLIELLTSFGFNYWGSKSTKNGDGSVKTENVYVRDFSRSADRQNPCSTFPFISRSSDVYFVSIFPDYHTELFPDSILRTESPNNFIENEPHRNAIRKSYISHSLKRDMKTGDILVFYRTGGFYKGVVTTIAVIESVNPKLTSENELLAFTKNRTVLSTEKLKEFWNKNPKNRPFVINLLYTYSLKNRLNLERLIELGIIEGTNKMPRGFHKMTQNNLLTILNDSQSNENIISD